MILAGHLKQRPRDEKKLFIEFTTLGAELCKTKKYVNFI